VEGKTSLIFNQFKTQSFNQSTFLPTVIHRRRLSCLMCRAKQVVGNVIYIEVLSYVRSIIILRGIVVRKMYSNM
jgi:hypothetical protein